MRKLLLISLLLLLVAAGCAVPAGDPTPTQEVLTPTETAQVFPTSTSEPFWNTDCVEGQLVRNTNPCLIAAQNNEPYDVSIVVDGLWGEEPTTVEPCDGEWCIDAAYAAFDVSFVLEPIETIPARVCHGINVFIEGDFRNARVADINFKVIIEFRKHDGSQPIFLRERSFATEFPEGSGEYVVDGERDMFFPFYTTEDGALTIIVHVRSEYAVGVAGNKIVLSAILVHDLGQRPGDCDGVSGI
jgi:hypothetical protein